MKKLILLVLLLPVCASAQIVSIPDSIFKAYLIGNTFINTNGDGEIQVSEATTFTGTINVFKHGISDLTGIEAFTALTELDCHYNTLTSLDVSKNTALTFLGCANNSLISLDISNNPVLEELICQNNNLILKLYHPPPSIIIMYSFQINELLYAVFPSSECDGGHNPANPPGGPWVQKFPFQMLDFLP